MARQVAAVSVLRQYPSYKPSGEEWLGKIPEHWNVLRGKQLFRCIDIRSTSGEEELLTVSSERGVVPRASATVTMFKAESYIGHKLCWPGDLVINSLWAWARGLGVSRHHGIISSAYGVYRLRHPYRDYSAFIHELVRSSPFHLELQVRSKGIWISRLQLTDEAFLGAKFPIPPSRDREAIVRFANEADRRIRRCIHAKEKLVKLLEEQRQALVNEAVTGRVDVRTGQPYPAYKPSAVEWLGEVPTHWVVASLRHRYQQCLGKMLDTKHISGEHLFPYLRNTDVQWDEINVAGLPTMDILPVEVDRYTVRRGDLLVCEGGEVGRCAIWDGDARVVGYQKALHRLRPHRKDRDIPRFMYHALRSATERGAFEDGHESTIGHLTGDKLRAHRFPFPPFSEQSAIARYLDHTDQHVGRNIRAARRQIHLLEECRTRLIADLVTGKLDVREAASGLPNVIGVTKSPTEPDAL